jgi:glycosyltransferase involved in cell wall biosynthesis
MPASPRICVLSTVHFAHDVRLFQAEARTLARAGFDVAVIALKDTTKSQTDGVHIISLPPQPNRLLRALQSVRILRLALRQRADLFAIHDPELLPAAVLLRLLTRRPVVYDVHEDVPAAIRGRRWLPRPLRPLIAGLYRFAEHLSLPFIAGLTLADHAYAKYYRRRRFEIILNYPLMTYADLYRPPEPSLGERPVLLYAGAVMRLRGVFEMLDLVQRLRGLFPTILLRVVGPVDKELEADRDEVVSRLGLEPNVEFTGPVSHTQVHDYILNADVCLALLHPDPNYLRSLPTKIFEYMMMGRPVVVSDFPMWKNIVEDAGCGVAVDPLDGDAAADAVRTLLNDDDSRTRMGKAGRQAVLERYSWEGEGQRLVAFYRELLGR